MMIGMVGPVTQTARRTRQVARRLTAPQGQPLELEDIQGNVVRGYGMPWAAHLFLRVEDPERGRRVLRELAEHVTMESAGGWPGGSKPDSTVNLAFTATGLVALEVPDAVMDTFPAEFLQGMEARAERVLGDTAVSAPERWEKGLRSAAHALVMLHATGEAERSRAIADIEHRIAESRGAITIVHRDLTHVLDGAREHFGFTDGFSQPAVAGSPVRMRAGEGVADGRGGWRPLRAGEFVLGYEDEDGGLPAAPAPPFGLNGTFMVYRKLEQDVARFRQLIRQGAPALGLEEEQLEAKIVGRWRDGSPLVLSPVRPDPTIGNDPDRTSAFLYKNDPQGFACPLGAHVRRANPRDALEGGTERSRRHRIIRRGMTYGPPFVADEDDGESRGLIFICFNASIHRQFEVIQNWLLDGNPFGASQDSDFLLGSNDGAFGKMTIQGDEPAFLSPQLPLVQTRGGEYLFVPGGRALASLLRDPQSAPHAEAIPIADPTVVSPAVPATPFARMVAARTAQALNANPMLACLRVARPVLKMTPTRWMLTREEDVREVLRRHEEFNVPYLIRMEAMTGPFILGFNDSATYQRERAALDAALGGAANHERIAKVSSERASLAIDSGGTVLDLVDDVTDTAIAAAITDIFGIGWPDPFTLLRWSRAVFWEVFINHDRDPEVIRQGQLNADAMRDHLDAHIAARRAALAAGEPPQDHALDRLLCQRAGEWADDTRLRDSVFGVIVAWAVSVSRALAFAFEELLRRPPELAAAQRAARSGDTNEVTMFLLEALRFRPATDALPRRCPHGATIAAGTPREQTIPPGAVVVAVTKSAMHDRREVDSPSRFSTHRPDDDYLHFGHGLHRCFGESIARVQMAAIASELLSRELRPSRGLIRSGPFPTSLRVAISGPPLRGPARQT
jgi:Dyp-type peroxidase family